MKAITIYQPRALLIACGEKKYETRSWAIRYVSGMVGERLLPTDI